MSKTNFDIKQFLTENKLTETSKKLDERVGRFDVEDIITANGLDHSDFKWSDTGKFAPQAGSDLKVMIDADKRTFDKIVGDMESSGIEILDFKHNGDSGWISPRVDS